MAAKQAANRCQTGVVLEATICIIFNPGKTKLLKTKVLLDPGSQKSYLSDTDKNQFQLDAIAKQNVSIKPWEKLPLKP